MNYMDLLGGGFPPGFEGQMPQPQQMQQRGGLFGGGGPPPQASQLPGVTQMPQFGQTPLQGMGLQSPVPDRETAAGPANAGLYAVKDQCDGTERDEHAGDESQHAEHGRPDFCLAA